MNRVWSGGGKPVTHPQTLIWSPCRDVCLLMVPDPGRIEAFRDPVRQRTSNLLKFEDPATRISKPGQALSHLQELFLSDGSQTRF
jgi:hypothetical protein